MRNRLGFVLLAAGALTGCPTTVVPAGDTTIFLPDSNMNDGGGRDGGPDMGMAACGATGTVGGQCRSSGVMCSSTAPCIDFSARTAGMTIEQVFGIPSGTLEDTAHPGYQAIDTSATAETADFNAAEGTLCGQQCNTVGDDMCGACTSCSAALTQMPLMQVFGGVLAILGNMPGDRMFGADTGLCRLDCTYDAATRGNECSDQNTCDHFSGVCVEACTSDNECNMAYGVTYEGELVTLVNHEHADVCNTTTGRCEQPAGTGSATANVGDHCESAADCREGTGFCLNGGHCAEFGCPNPGTATSVCGGTSNNLGICLPTNDHNPPTSLCLAGCNTATDCGPGNICNVLLDMAGNVVMIGAFSGYCIGVCETDDQCLAAESCTDYNTVDAMTGVVTSNNGRCMPRCTMPGETGTVAGCAADEWCSPDASNTNGHACTGAGDCAAPYTMCSFGVCRSSAPSFGQCAALGTFCGDVNTNHLAAHQSDCAASQVCDETLATPHDPMTHLVDREQFGDGHCVNPCTDLADCAGYPAGSVCVTTGAYAGLCRVPCTGAGGDAGTGDAGTAAMCPVDQSCDGTEHFCAEVAAPPPPP